MAELPPTFAKILPARRQLQTGARCANCSHLAESGERTRLACWFRRLAETNFTEARESFSARKVRFAISKALPHTARMRSHLQEQRVSRSAQRRFRISPSPLAVSCVGAAASS